MHGTGRLHIVNGTMCQVQYKEVLLIKLLAQIIEWYSEEDDKCGFMQDGVPCHMAKSVLRFLEDNDIEVLPWVGNSPDCVWEIVKDRLKKIKIMTRGQLIKEVTRTWHEDPDIQRLCVPLINSMPRRLAAVMHNKGFHTKYRIINCNGNLNKVRELQLSLIIQS